MNTENNKIIAEFMGVLVTGENFRNELVGQINGKLTGALNYHKDWRCLMPVIEKISILNLPDPDGSSEYWQPFPRTFGMTNDENGYYMFRFNRYSLFEAKTLIEAAYLAVVDFVKSHQNSLTP